MKGVRRTGKGRVLHTLSLSVVAGRGYLSVEVYLTYIIGCFDHAHGARSQTDYQGQFRIGELLYQDLLGATAIARDAVVRLGRVPDVQPAVAPESGLSAYA
jgi:hypothetical protein